MNSNSYFLTRRIFAAGLGLIYLNVFCIFIFQGQALFGETGLLPYRELVPQILSNTSNVYEAFWQSLSLFVFDHSDTAIWIVGIVGAALSLLPVFGYVNFPILFLLWLLHLSIVQLGQIFYSYGWETQLLELTFLSFFFFPLWNPKLNRPESPPKIIPLLFMRWMMFRLMLGAGLIKIRGDECWRDFSCMQYHYETQPNPHPLSWFLHQMPNWHHLLEVAGNHFVELVLPFFLFGPRKLRRIAALIMIAFQITLIFSGNLSWLNWLTLLMAIPCLDDEFFKKFIRWPSYFNVPQHPKSLATKLTLICFCGFGIYLSIDPALNLISENQRMNSSYNRFHLINSYGAFGSIGKVRNEIIISGTTDAIITEQTKWFEYEFKCKPGAVDRRPCLITPYHYRLDWQIWFSAMRPQLSELWLLRLGIAMLENNQNVLSLIEAPPFQTAPRYIKMDLYRYQFTEFGESNWWTRKYLGPYTEPLSLNHQLVQQYRLR